MPAVEAVATAARSSTLCTLRSVPFGKYWRSSPLQPRRLEPQAPFEHVTAYQVGRRSSMPNPKARWRPTPRARNGPKTCGSWTARTPVKVASGPSCTRWPAPRARPGTRGPGHRTCRLRARGSGSSPRPPAGQRVVGLQGGLEGCAFLIADPLMAEQRVGVSGPA